MVKITVPEGLGEGGSALWSDVTSVHELDTMQKVTLLEICRSKDRLDKLDQLLCGDIDTWARVTVYGDDEYELKIDQTLAQANSTANLMKQLIAALRLPDQVTGKKPQARGPRGAYNKSGTVSSLDRARSKTA